MSNSNTSDTTTTSSSSTSATSSNSSSSGSTSISLPQIRQLLQQVIKADTKKWFLSPVDPVAENLPDYNEKISTPMDLGTVRSRLDESAENYKSTSDVVDDILLTFKNAILYNGATSAVAQEAIRLRIFFEQRYSQIL